MPADAHLTDGQRSYLTTHLYRNGRFACGCSEEPYLKQVAVSACHVSAAGTARSLCSTIPASTLAEPRRRAICCRRWSPPTDSYEGGGKTDSGSTPCSPQPGITRGPLQPWHCDTYPTFDTCKRTPPLPERTPPEWTVIRALGQELGEDSSDQETNDRPALAVSIAARTDQTDSHAAVRARRSSLRCRGAKVVRRR